MTAKKVSFTFRVLVLRILKLKVFCLSHFHVSSSSRLIELASTTPPIIPRETIPDMRRFRSKTDYLMENARRKRRPQVPIDAQRTSKLRYKETLKNTRLILGVIGG